MLETSRTLSTQPPTKQTTFPRVKKLALGVLLLVAATLILPRLTSTGQPQKPTNHFEHRLAKHFSALKTQIEQFEHKSALPHIFARHLLDTGDALKAYKDFSGNVNQAQVVSKKTGNMIQTADMAAKTFEKFRNGDLAGIASSLLGGNTAGSIKNTITNGLTNGLSNAVGNFFGYKSSKKVKIDETAEKAKHLSKHEKRAVHDLLEDFNLMQYVTDARTTHRRVDDRLVSTKSILDGVDKYSKILQQVSSGNIQGAIGALTGAAKGAGGNNNGGGFMGWVKSWFEHSVTQLKELPGLVDGNIKMTHLMHLEVNRRGVEAMESFGDKIFGGGLKSAFEKTKELVDHLGGVTTQEKPAGKDVKALGGYLRHLKSVVAQTRDVGLNEFLGTFQTLCAKIIFDHNKKMAAEAA